MKKILLFFTIILSVVLGSFMTIGVQYFKRVKLPEPAYKVGDCLSNGLFFERIEGIRTDRFLGDKLYLIRHYIDGRKKHSDTVEVWIADRNYLLVPPEYCMEDGE